MSAAWAVLTLALTACTSPSTPSRVAPDALLASIRAGTAPVVVDVRMRSEYDLAHVPGAISIPFYALLAREDELPGPRTEVVVVYCNHGPRAGMAKLALRLVGFTDVRYLDGHMSGWKKRGLPTEPPTASSPPVVATPRDPRQETTTQ